MNLGDRIAVMSDIHGEHRVLNRVLEECRDTGVHGVVLLGDLFDRLDHARGCAEALADWPIAGVLGNHERDALQQERVKNDDHQLCRLIERLGDRFRLDEALFVHDVIDLSADLPADEVSARLIFTGHTHYRTASDERGPIDISLGRIQLRSNGRYVINPGAVVEGQFAIWDRQESQVTFKRV